ncbi:MAG: hypothetical protein IIB95_08785 [Candidatus Marinimicrobia bacterium]|nr:hypothetical protein [Candidatus Neomarinimicrobiota bacterium]MCH7763825.1 hypothetical protein [Candidatus Neomarinimicrobiota bacterium]
MKLNIILFSCFAWMACTAPEMPDPEDIINETSIKVPLPTKSVILPKKNLPKGWTVNRETLANWQSSLPEVLGISLDTNTTAEFWEEGMTLKSGIKLPLKRAKVTFHHQTRITSEIIELQFINVDFIYSVTNYESSHYELDGVLKTVELRGTGFPQLIADDVLRHKVLMVYGTPDDFDGIWHHYKDKDTKFSVRVIDDRHLAVRMISRVVEKKLKQALQDMYSDEGIELRKQQLMDGFDL